MNKSLFLGIDAGTESTRAVLFDCQGKQLAQASAETRNSFPRSGWAEQQPDDLISTLIQAVRDCTNQIPADRVEDIVGLCVDGTCSTVVFATQSGKPLRNAILWMDTRADHETQIIKETNHPILKYSGGEDAVEWLIPKALWVKQHEPEVYSCSEVIAEAIDLMNFWLTGEWTASICNATDAWNYVSVEGGFSRDFFGAIGAPELLEKLPQRVLAMGSVIGKLTDQAAKELGLPDNVVVAQGGIDAHAGLLGLGVSEPGTLGLTIGSSSVHLAYSEKPRYIQGIWGPYPDIILPGKWLLQGGQSSTGSVLKWFKDRVSPASKMAQLQGKRPYEVLDALASALPPGANGVTMIEHFQGNRSPYRNPRSQGTILGLTLATREEDIFRAALESAAYGTRLILETLARDGLEIDNIVASGGGTRSELWMQIHADVCGLPLNITQTENVAALGSAMCAAVASGMYSDLWCAMDVMKGQCQLLKPDMGAHSDYLDPYEKYLEAYGSVKPYYDRSARGGN